MELNPNSEEYRYGMNKQESDNEISGTYGTHYSAMFWEYDSRLGRRWNLDPKPQIAISDYACFANNPVWFSDPLGDKIRYGKTEYRSKAGVYLRVLWNRIINKQFRRDHRFMRQDNEDTFIYQEVDPNAIPTAAVNPRSIITNNNPYDNNNPFMKSTNGWGQNDKVEDKVFLSYRTRNKERHDWWGVGKLPNGKFGTNKAQHHIANHHYRAGTITIRCVSNEANDTGQDNLIIRHGGVIIRTIQMPTNNPGSYLQLTIPFSSGTAGSISFEISNPNYPNNTPGAFDVKVKIKSL
ncbi:hypothetical protein SDC9_74147 [bioreactor metagenome]|uniref:RHS repeat-associated core domain-containing protein n=1 Tax=bioreactor metagenome TaxID=1076179 RepID=A0A644YNH2_9ZZZZ